MQSYDVPWRFPLFHMYDSKALYLFCTNENVIYSLLISCIQLCIHFVIFIIDNPQMLRFNVTL